MVTGRNCSREQMLYWDLEYRVNFGGGRRVRIEGEEKFVNKKLGRRVVQIVRIIIL